MFVGYHPQPGRGPRPALCSSPAKSVAVPGGNSPRIGLLARYEATAKPKAGGGGKNFRELWDPKVGGAFRSKRIEARERAAPASPTFSRSTHVRRGNASAGGRKTTPRSQQNARQTHSGFLTLGKMCQRGPHNAPRPRPPLVRSVASLKATQGALSRALPRAFPVSSPLADPSTREAARRGRSPPAARRFK